MFGQWFDVSELTSAWKGKRRGSNADNSILLAVQTNFPAKNMRIGVELAVPERIAENDHMVLTLFRFLRQKTAPQSWLHSK